MEDNKEKIIDDLVLITLNNGFIVKCKKEDIPSILSSNRED